MRTKAMPRPGLPASDFTARWQALCTRYAAVLSPTALMLGIVLAISWFCGGFFQFLTPLYEALPGLAIAHALVNAGIALAFGGAIAVRGRFERLQWALIGAAIVVFVLSVGSVGAKLEYARGLAGNPYYALPHQPTSYPKEAQAIALRTSDGVRLAGTYLDGHHSRAILIYPSWRTNRNAFSIVSIAEWLSGDADVLVLDPRGQGESDGAKTPDGAGKYDLLAGVAYLKSTGHDRIGVLAEQDGAYAAMLAAGMHEGIDSLALLEPSDDWGASLGQSGGMWDPHTLWGHLYWRVAAGLRLAGGPPGVPPVEAVRVVAPTPVLFLGSRTPDGSSVDQLHMAAG
ncbi:MAG TPA: hypothetical protein V6D47_07440, partial [Oscillatoriaceae cyanobacterium]